MESVSKCLSFEGSAFSDQDLMLFVCFFFFAMDRRERKKLWLSLYTAENNK